MAFRTNEEVRITGVLGTASNSTVTCSKVINWRDGSGLEYDASWTAAAVKIYTSKSNYEYGVCSASGGTLTFTMKGLDASNSKTEVASNKKQWRPGTKVAFVATASDLVDLDGDNTFTGTNTFVDINFSGTSTGGLKLKSLTTAQMNALAAPANGMMIYNSTAGENYQYIGGAWSAVSAGSTQANSSTTVAGKLETATSAESIAANADTGGTGANLVVLPSDIAKNIQSSTFVYGADAGGDDTYVVALTPVLASYTTGQRLQFKVTTANTSACSVDFGPGAKNIKTLDGNDPQTGAIRASQVVTVVYDGTNMILQNEDISSTGNKGIIETATLAEQIARTSTTLAVTPEGLGAVTQVAFLQGTRAVDAASGDQVIAHGLTTTPKRIQVTVTTVSNTVGGQSISQGYSNGTSHKCTYLGTFDSGGYADVAGNNASACAFIISYGTNGDATQSAVAALDGTNITLTWTYTADTTVPTQTMYITILAHA